MSKEVVEQDQETLTEEQKWVKWLEHYGAAQFYRAFIATAQDARSMCAYCESYIYLDIVEGGGVPDWKTEDGDYGCSSNVDEDGVGGHCPHKL